MKTLFTIDQMLRCRLMNKPHAWCIVVCDMYCLLLPKKNNKKTIKNCIIYSMPWQHLCSRSYFQFMLASSQSCWVLCVLYRCTCLKTLIPTEDTFVRIIMHKKDNNQYIVYRLHLMISDYIKKILIKKKEIKIKNCKVW